MRLVTIQKEDTHAVVAATLSRRNLLTLLTRIYAPERATITMNGLHRGVAYYLGITAETDEAHYPDRGPGPITTSVEQALQIAADLLNQVEDSLGEDDKTMIGYGLEKTANQIGYLATQLAGRSVQIV